MILKRNKRIIKSICFIIGLLVFSTITVPSSFGASPAKVAVFPFTMNSKDDLSFLQKGLFSMLATRLTDPGKVMVLDRETVDAATITAQKQALTKGALNVSKARILGANMSVDYILFGSMTHFGDSFSIDGSMVDVHGVKPTVSFFEQSSSLGDAIPLVNTFAEDINQKVFNRGVRNKNQNARPENTDAQRGFQSTERQEGSSQNNSPFINTRASGKKDFIKRFRIGEVLTCMATGDTDNDGQIDVVTATDTEIKILQPQGNLLVEKKKISDISNIEIVAMDIADINGNGIPEIFVTALTALRKHVNSFIIEYDKAKGYQIIAKNKPYYYRVIETKENGKILFGQKKGMSPFNNKIYKMQWENNDYALGERIKTPRKVSVLSLTNGTIGDKGISEYFNINESGYLNIFNDNGKEEWRARETTGGSKHFFILADIGIGQTNENRTFLHPRLKLYDNKHDGQNELFVIHNLEINSVMKRYKKFVKGTIEISSWNGMAIAPISKTRTVQGWISDFAIADTDNNGTDELLVSVVEDEKTSAFTGKNRSYIISYNLQ
jgi:TolB-like protein